MDHMNIVIVSGILQESPDIRSVSTTEVCHLRLKSSRSYKGKDGEQREQSCYIDVDAWGALAGVVSREAAQGDVLLVHGNLDFQSWEDKKTGQKRSKLLVRAMSVSVVARAGGMPAPPQEQARSEPPSKTPNPFDDVPF